jgi:hypothetical protein
MVDTKTYDILHPINAESSVRRDIDDCTMTKDEPPQSTKYPTLSFCCRRKLRALDSTTKSGVSWRLIMEISLVNAWNLGKLRVEHIGNI